jgi:Pyridoxamine 5'-phosphate oxidase
VELRARGRPERGIGMLSEDLRAFLDACPVGVLATRPAAGTPRQSLVYFVCHGERLLISTLGNRLKARDVTTTRWASLCVMGHVPPYPSATFSGPAEILTESIGTPTAAIAQRITGASEPPEPMSDATLAEAGRVILAITVERVTAASYIPATTEDADKQR